VARRRRGRDCKGNTCREWADSFAKEKPKTAAAVGLAEVVVVGYIGYKAVVKALQYI
jgi:hypothetical protein|tara:strand:+ start:2984 stop:3154 length:171 start_codon:yes stop_codon:yes gene_type:complete